MSTYLASPAVIAPAVLDWESFCAVHYPRLRRHELEAVIAYGIYRRSCEPESGESTQIETREDDHTKVTALRGWEDEGGA